MKRAWTKQFILAAALTGAMPPFAAAQLLNATTSPDSLPAFTGAGLESLWPSLAQLAGALVFVLALIWGTTWLARRLMKGRFGGGAEDHMRVLERLHLAPKKSVEIVAVGKRVLVLGVTENQIGLLTELESGDLSQPGTQPTLSGSTRQTAGRQRALMNEARHKLNELFRSARPTDVETAPSR